MTDRFHSERQACAGERRSAVAPRKGSGRAVPAHVLRAALNVWGQAGERHLISVQGGSMLPLIQDGDFVLVVYGCAGVRRGDVIVFWRGEAGGISRPASYRARAREGGLVAHRVLRICDGDGGLTFVTKGDNSSWCDPPVSAEGIVGRVVAVERDGRYMSLDTPVWRVVGRLIAVVTLAWVRLYDAGRALKLRFLGPQPNRATAALRRGALALFSLFRRTAQAVACRWED